jgi:YgiT-type zinc finger domain-containing protein
MIAFLISWVLLSLLFFLVIKNGRRMKKKCEICGSDTRIVISDHKYTYKGHNVIIPNYKKIVCDHCGLDTADSASIKAGVHAHCKIDGLLRTGHKAQNYSAYLDEQAEKDRRLQSYSTGGYNP